MARALYTSATNVYLADFYSWTMVCWANFVGVQILASPNGAAAVHLVYRTVHECQGHSLYCHLNASHLNDFGMENKLLIYCGDVWCRVCVCVVTHCQ